MKAIVQDRFGPPDVLKLREIDEPQAGDGDVLVQVSAASVNPADWYAMAAVPYVARPQMGLRKPRATRVGIDVAGWWRPSAALKPPNLLFEQAAAVPVARPPPCRAFTTRVGSSRGSRC